MLECDFCGCYSPKPGKGWVTCPAEKYARTDEPGLLTFCPPCAAVVLGVRPDLATEYVCIFEPQPPPTEPIGTSPG